MKTSSICERLETYQPSNPETETHINNVHEVASLFGRAWLPMLEDELTRLLIDQMREDGTLHAHAAQHSNKGGDQPPTASQEIIMNSIVQDGITISERFSKATKTILDQCKGDTSLASSKINGLAKYKFGLTLEEYNLMVDAGNFGRLAIQKNRHEHMLAQEREKKAEATAKAQEARKLLEPIVDDWLIKPGF